MKSTLFIAYTVVGSLTQTREAIISRNLAVMFVSIVPIVEKRSNRNSKRLAKLTSARQRPTSASVLPACVKQKPPCSQKSLSALCSSSAPFPLLHKGTFPLCLWACCRRRSNRVGTCSVSESEKREALSDVCRPLEALKVYGRFPARSWAPPYKK